MPPAKSFDIHYAGFGLACCYGVLAWASRSETGISLLLFYSIIAIALIFYFWPRHRNSSQPKLAAVFGWAMLFRLLGLIGTPLFEDDFYRYLWDGYRLAMDGNPYQKAPEAFFNDRTVLPAFQFILGHINYPELPSVYGPGLQFLFGLSYWLAPAVLWPLKLLLIGCDMLLIAMLARIGKVEDVLLYAWNPLVIKEIAFTAHPDGLLPLLLIAAWLCLKQGRLYSSATLLAVAVTVKIPALLIAPFLLWRMGWKPMLCFGLVVFACYLPFMDGRGNDLFSLFYFGQNWQFNSAFYGLLQLFMPGASARFILGWGVIVFVYSQWRRYQRLPMTSLPRVDLIFAVLIFASPTINPWYWLWVLPFSVIFPGRWPWVASVALLLAYITGLNLESETLKAYQQPIWTPWLEFGLISLAVWLEYLPCFTKK